jgi:hypothetical protein
MQYNSYAAAVGRGSAGVSGRFGSRFDLRAVALASLLAVLLACTGAAEAAYPGLEAVGWDDFEPFRPLWREDELARMPELARATRYHLRLRLADDLSRATGSLEVRYFNRGTEPVSELPFVCYPNLTGGALAVSAARVGGVEVRPSTRNIGGLLTVPLPEPVAPGEAVIVELEYTLRVPPADSRSAGVLGLGGGVLSLAYAYPMIPARKAWDRGRPAHFGDFVTNEAGFFVVEASAPDDVVMVLPGIELARRKEGGRTRVLCALGPARDFYLAAGRHLAVVERQYGEVTVRSYAPPDRMEGAALVLEAAGEALESFSRRFGPYPFTLMSVAAAPFRSLGMEFSGIMLLALRLYDLEADAQGPSHRVLLEGTLAHEVAHQWFYLTVGTDQAMEPWIDESIAQYAYWLYYRDRYGEEAARGAFAEFDDRWNRIDRAAVPIGKAVSDYAPGEYGAIIYGRAPLFLHALSGIVGEECFDRLLEELVARYRWRMVDGQEFMSLAEKLCGCELDGLWQEWVVPEAEGRR